MQMRDMNLRGVRDVFSFTLGQYMKSKSTIISIAIMFLAALGGLLISSMNSGARTDTAIKEIYLVDAAESGITLEDIANADARFAGARETGMDSCDAGVSVAFENDSYIVYAWRGNDAPDDEEISALETAAVSAVNAKLFGVPGEGYQTKLVGQAEYFDPQPEEEDKFEARFAISYVYSIIVLMLVLFTTAYIIRAIIEEKDSKLVELLMVSVSPLALITGKILAAMCTVLIELGAMLLGAAGALTISKFVIKDSAVMGMLTNAGVLDSLQNLNLFTGISIIAAIVLGFLTFSIIGGVLGACCSSLEDSNTASLTVTLLALGGYLCSAVVMMFDGAAVSVISSLFPVLCVFCAPIRYALGDISAWLLLLSLLLQAAQVALLFRFCANVYGELIMRRGARVKLKQLFTLAGKEARTNV